MIPRTFRFFPWLLLTLTLLAGGCGGGGGAGGSGTANTAPTLNPIGNKVVAPNNNLSFTVSASAANPKDTIQLFAEGLPSGAAFSATTGIFSWTPTSLQYGDYSVTFVASSGVNETTETILISVRDNLILTLSTQAVDITENQPLSVTATASAPTSLSASGLPPGASFDQATGIFTWTPQLVTPGQFQVVVTATNGIDSTSKTLTINYNRTNPLLGADITDPSLRGITIFPQTTPALDGVPELFPGQANFWDIDPDIAQFDGFWNQFIGNLVLAVDDLGAVGEKSFLLDQRFAELTFMTPLLSALDGLKVASVADHADYAGPDPNFTIVFDPLVEGARSAWLNATADSRLQQTLDLRQASAPLTLSWGDEFLVQSGGFFDAPEDDIPYYRVMATDLATGVRTEIFNGPRSDRGVVETAPVSRTRETRTANLDALAGKQVLLSFELRGGHQLLDDETYLGSYALIDNVSLRDGSNAEHVVNGDFESGMTGWTTNSALQSQNLRSAPRTVNGLTVTRHFYTVPNQLWARWTDVLENPTDAPITRRVVLRTFLGSAFKGIIYLDDAINPRALTFWDGTALVDVPDRDIGLVFGSPAIVFGNSLPNIAAANEGINANISASALDTEDGSDTIDIVHDVTIPARGRVTLVHFALMSGENTGATASDISARATTIDAARDDILANFCSNPRYRDGMTAAQLASLQNFTCP
ncbi:MAG: Ig domain-containing protein [Trichloromonadaceae bacterium]